jgi:Beta propeller domain
VTARTAVVCAAASLALLSGCTAAPAPRGKPSHGSTAGEGAYRLAAAPSCDDLMSGLHAATRALVHPYGLPGMGVAYGAADNAAGPKSAAGAAPGAAPGAGPDRQSTPEHSDTNVAEAGVDEPDLVKTDGRRIVTVSGGLLRVVDAASHQVTGTLPVGQDGNLLLAGDRLLLLQPWSGGPVEGGAPGVDAGGGPQLLLIDLAGGTPRLLGSYAIDGQLLDARQVGGRVRVVVHSAPRIAFPMLERADAAQRIAANQAAVDGTGPDGWLPRYRVTTGGKTTYGRVDCGSVRLPAQYSGTSMLSLLTFDLAAPSLGSGDPETIVADGNIVYATADNLYVVSENRWLGWPRPMDAPGAPTRKVSEQTDIYQFDTSGARARYVAAGSVPGWLLNQYAMSDWNGYLRVATTLNQASSSVTVLQRNGGELRKVGEVGGLGKGERIYAVRYAGPVGYVVTFRQTDPLYTLDLRDPIRPAVTGTLEIDGYSAYLHPAGDGKLIGVGQASNGNGRNLGLQVSLFDVSDPTRPSRLDRYQLLGSGHSTVEMDPHGFLYWPATGLVVVPIQQDAVALRVAGARLQEAGRLDHPQGQVLRALVIGTSLWTLSTAGLAANDLTSLAPQAWVGF